MNSDGTPHIHGLGADVSTPSVSIIVPVANEGDALTRIVPKFVNDCSARLNGLGPPELILVTDVSSQPTLDAMAYLAKSGCAKCYQVSPHVGKGGSLKNALRFVRCGVVAYVDADFPIQPDELRLAVEKVVKGDADVVAAERVTRPHGLGRMFLSGGYNALVNKLFNTGLRDHQAGFKVMKADAAAKLFDKIRSDGFGFDTELIVYSKRLGYKLVTQRVHWKEQRRKSNVRSLRTIATTLVDIVTLRVVLLVAGNPTLVKEVVGRVVDLANGSQAGPAWITVLGLRRSRVAKVVRMFYTALIAPSG